MNDGVAVGLRWCGHGFGRHVAGLEPLGNQRPTGMIAGHVRQRFVNTKVQLGRGSSTAMTTKAMLGKKGLDAGLKAPLE
ncbi:MAG: hypothetical protein ACK5TN_06310 [Acidobacteriota bacterium]